MKRSINKLVNKKIFLLFFCFVISFIMLLLCSKCSFLYPFNGWDDFNSFYTVGSGWANGLIPYRDLFEQKGPFLYLIFMIGYLITPGKFIGIFILEIIFMTLTLYYSSKIIDLFIDKNKDRFVKYLILLLYSIMLTTSVSFIEGGSSEEFNLIFTTITVFYILKNLKNNDMVNITYKELIVCGLCCGLSIMIKYTTIGLWFIMMAYISIRLIKLRKYKEAIFKGLIFVFSMLIPLLIFSIYFYMNNCLYDFLNVYFYINIFKYSSDTGILANLFKTISNICSAFLSNIPLVIIFYIVFCYYLRMIVKYSYKFRFSIKKRIFVFMILFSLFILYYGQNFRPYAITSMFFIILLIIIYLYRMFHNYRIFKISCVIYIISSLLFGIDYKYMNVNQDDVVQYRFAKIMNQENNPTLLHYRSIDEGFYTAANILPQNKYFEQVNLDTRELPDSYIEQDNIIKHKKVMFVVVRKFDMNRHGGYMDFNKKSKESFNLRANLDYINTYYDLVDEYHNSVGYYDSCVYYLFKAKD